MNERVKLYFQGTFWVLVYLVVILAPLFALLLGPVPTARGFWREFSVALGFAGLAMMGCQFALTARFQRVKAPFGSDIVYFFHRQISLVAFVLILAHPLILFVTAPDTLQLLNVLAAPWRARAGVTALLALAALIALSLWRKQFKFHYDEWRIWHGVLATAAVALAMAHIVGVGHYVGTPWKRTLWIGYGTAWVGLLAYVRIFKPWRELKHPYRVEQVIQERGNAWTLALRPDGHKGIKFSPGQFAWLTIWDSPFSDRDHPFSFSSSAAHSERLEFTVKELGDFTARIKEVKPGQVVYLDGPHGAFSIDRHPRAPGYVFIAGGVGITPIMSMLRTLADRDDRRPLLLIYANKTWETVTFQEEIKSLQERLNLQVVYVLEQPPDDWKGEKGFVNADLLKRYLPEDLGRHEHFICGPEPMMNAVEKTLNRLGVPFARFHSERFNLV
jgi:predicted ferric reductase